MNSSRRAAGAPRSRREAGRAGRALRLGVLAACALLLAAPGGLAAPRQIRLGVVERAGTVLVSASGPAEIVDAYGRAIGKLQALEGWSVASDGPRLVWTGPNGQSLVALAPMHLQLAGSAPNGVPLVFARDRWYRGALEFRANGGAVSAINVLPLEEYLYGVVPAEMPTSWPKESLKSQAVAARSYALANLGKHRSRGFDLCGTDDCQVYGGAARETVASNGAVDATRGEVITYNGHVVSAYFHSSSGGYTENSEDVWERKLPYIRAVPDFDQASPHYSWVKSVSVDELTKRLTGLGVSVGQVTQLVPVERSYSGRVKSLQVVGTAGTRVVSGETLRTAAGLGSTLFNVALVSDGAFAFAGRGWGHGLGMSQWGARNLAENGYNYLQILGHYYPNAQLGKS